MTNLQFPKNLLKPVGDFLKNKLAMLRINRKKISTEDPFNDKTRDLDSAQLILKQKSNMVMLELLLLKLN